MTTIVDPFRRNSYGIMHAPDDSFAITPDDDNELDRPTRMIAFTVEGPLHVETLAGTERTYPAGLLAPGVQHVLRVRKVFATGTAVGEIEGWP